MDVSHRKAVEIILNSENISGQQNQEMDSFICWRMVNFMKIDFQARSSKRMGIVQTKPYFFYETFEITTPDNSAKSAMVQWKLNFLIQKYLLFLLDLVRKSI